MAAWLASVCLPENPVIEYQGSREDLLRQSVWFSLRGMGVTDRAIQTYFNPKALALLFDDETEHKVSRH